MSRLLLVEDDDSLALAIEFTLNEAKYEVVRTATLAQSKKIIDEHTFDLLILDVNLPDGSGYEFCQYVRLKSNVPIMFLTALDEEVNIVLGLEMGGDDYVTKPFRVKEFLSRIKSLLRRNLTPAYQVSKLISGNLSVDVHTATVKKHQMELTLTAQEYRLLLIFLSKPMVLMKREELLTELTEDAETFFDDNTLAVYIKRLREKIEDHPREPAYIVTNRGLGYKWNLDVVKEGM